jgi:hypothetical protein
MLAINPNPDVAETRIVTTVEIYSQFGRGEAIAMALDVLQQN